MYSQGPDSSLGGKVLLGGLLPAMGMGVTQGMDLSFVIPGDEELQNVIESFEV